MTLSIKHLTVACFTLLSKIRVVAVLVMLIVLALPIYTQAQILESTKQSPLYHPDGLIGKLAFHAGGAYSSVATDYPLPAKDFQTYNLGLDIVLFSRLTLKNTALMENKDTVKYQLQSGVSFYFKNPSKNLSKANPDGPIGGPVLTLSGGVRFNNGTERNSSWLGIVDMAVPLSPYLTIKSGYQFYENMQRLDLVGAFGQVTFYTASYAPDSAYVNPDGKAGSLVIRLTGGGSSHGIKGQAEFLFPLEPTLTLAAIFRLERSVAPVHRALTAGAALSYYPQR